MRGIEEDAGQGRGRPQEVSKENLYASLSLRMVLSTGFKGVELKGDGWVVGLLMGRRRCQRRKTW
jgi:hypothetical protein